MTRQYPLPLPHRETMGTDDFMIADCNHNALRWVEAWPRWPAAGLVIHGSSGSGKTHLAHVWRGTSKAEFIATAALESANIRDLIPYSKTVIIDNADKVAGNNASEVALFHFFNHMQEIKGSFLLTSVMVPSLWRVRLPDLRSRLLALPSVGIELPDDDLLSAMLVKQFHDRQIAISTEVMEYLVSRIERTAAAVRDIVTALDRASLSEKRAITVALAKRIVDEQHFLFSDSALD